MKNETLEHLQSIQSRHASHPCVLVTSVAGAARTAGAQPLWWLQVGPRERVPICPAWLGSLKPSAAHPSLLHPPSTSACSHRADHTNQALIYSIYTILISLHCDYRECEKCPSPACPHPAKCEPINGGGGGVRSAKPQSTSSRWQPSLRWLWSQCRVNNTWPGPAAHSNWGYVPGNTLMNN